MIKTQLARPDAVDDLDAYVTATKQRIEPSTRPSIWEPSASANTSDGPIAIPTEHDLIEVIMSPVAPGERHREGNDRKERELAALLDKLTPTQSLALGKRLENAAAADPLVAAFDRLLPQRRVRLLQYLARRRTVAVTLAQRSDG